MKDRHIGSSFDGFLEEEGIKEEVTIEAYEKVVEQLKADRNELANAIVDNCYTGRYGNECLVCNKWHTEMPHDPDCIVPKAEKIIEEIEK